MKDWNEFYKTISETTDPIKFEKEIIEETRTALKFIFRDANIIEESTDLARVIFDFSIELRNLTLFCDIKLSKVSLARFWRKQIPTISQQLMKIVKVKPSKYLLILVESEDSASKLSLDPKYPNIIVINLKMLFQIRNFIVHKSIPSKFIEYLIQESSGVLYDEFIYKLLSTIEKFESPNLERQIEFLFQNINEEILEINKEKFLMNIRDYHTKKPSLLIFMIMPFEKELNQIYERYIKKLLESKGHEVRRADDFSKLTPILETILDSISVADVIIAELTDRNANVFYELGRAHEKDKYILHICQNEKDIPSFLRPARTIIYKDSPEGYEHLKDQLLRYVEEAQQSGLMILREPINLHRNQAIEILQNFILPITDRLERIIENVKSEDYSWNHNQQTMEKVLEIREPIGIHSSIFRRFVEKEALIKNINSYNEIRKKMEITLIEIDALIYSDEFRNRCKDLILTFNKEIDDPTFKIPNDEEYSVYFANYVINNRKDLINRGYRAYDFWVKYGSELLKFRERRKIALKFDILRNISENLIQIIKALLDKLNKIIEKYIIEFNLTSKDLERKFSAF